MNKRTGFTLMKLPVVIAIVAPLMAMPMPALNEEAGRGHGLRGEYETTGPHYLRRTQMTVRAISTTGLSGKLPERGAAADEKPKRLSERIQEHRE